MSVKDSYFQEFCFPDMILAVSGQIKHMRKCLNLGIIGLYKSDQRHGIFYGWDHMQYALWY